MRANLLFIRAKFEEFNSLFFDSSLPPITLRIGNARSRYGSFRYPARYHISKPRGRGECIITISSRFDLPQNEIEDILIHEMIHYWEWINYIDETPHGSMFIKKMTEINQRFGRNISIRKESDEKTNRSDILLKPHYICVIKWDDGRLGIFVSARTRIFELNRIIEGIERIKAIEWYWSLDAWFNQFPTVRSAKAWNLTEADYNAHVKNQLRCEIVGDRFRAKNIPPNN